MAGKYDIGPRISIEGEKEYREQLKNIVAEQKLLDSSMAEVTSRFDGQANSMEALRAKTEVLSKQQELLASKTQLISDAYEKTQYNLQESTARVEGQKEAIEALRLGMERYGNSFDRVNPQTGEFVEHVDDAAKELKKLEDELVKLEAAQREAATANSNAGAQLNYVQVAANDVNAELKKTEAYLDEAANSATGAATSIDRFGKEAKETSIDVDKFGEEVKETSTETSRFGDILKGAFLANIGTAALSLIASKLKEIASEAFNTADELMRLSDVTGRDVEELQKLQYIGDDVGVSLDTIASAQKRITRSMDEAREGNAEYADAFKALNIEVTNADGSLRSATEVMYDAFDALGKMSNETERDALAMQTMGRSAAELNPLIVAGGDALRELGDAAEQSGAIMSERAVAALDAFGDGLSHLKQSAVSFVGEGLANIMGVFDGSEVDKYNEFSKAVQEEQGKTERATIAAASVAEKYIQRLKELEEQGLNTNEAQKEYSNLVELLNRTIPDLNVVIDNQTGRIKGGTAALLENVEAWKQNALAQAVTRAADQYINKLAEVVVSEQEAYLAYEGATTAREAAIDRRIEITDRLNELEEKGKNITAEEKKEAEALGEEYDAVYATISELNKEVTILGSKYNEAAEATEAARIEAEDYATAAAAALKTLEDNTYALDDNTDSLDDNSDSVETAEEKAKRLAATLKINTDATKKYLDGTSDLTGGIDGLTSALDEQHSQGELTHGTILKLIEDGYAAALSVDEETGAVHLNREAYIALLNAKLEEQRASAQAASREARANALYAEEGAANAAAKGNIEYAASLWAVAAASEAEAAGIDASLAAFEKAIAGLNNYKPSGGGGGGRSGGAAKTVVDEAAEAAKKQLESFKKIQKDLDHEYAMGERSQQEHYLALKEAADEYLTDEDNLDEYRRIQEQIYQYQTEMLDNSLRAWEANSEAIAAEFQQLIDEVSARYDELEQKQQAMISQLKSSVELYERDEEKNPLLIDLTAQIQQIEQYGDSMAALKGKLPDDLLDDIFTGDIELGIALGGQILDMDEAELQAYVKDWETLQEKIAEVGSVRYDDELSALDELRTTYESALEEAMSALDTSAFEIGRDTLDGLIEGLASKEDELYRKAQEIADNIENTLRGALDTHSPSRVAYNIMRDFGAGLEWGVDDSAAPLRRTIEHILPSSIVEPVQDTTAQTAAMVNAFGTLTSGMMDALGSSAGSGNAGDVILKINDVEIARATLSAYRELSRSSPEYLPDF